MARAVLQTDPARRALMQRIRQRRTKVEDVLAVELRRLGVHYRRNDKRLPGSPDFVNRRRGWAIFVNGCFWHHHKCCTRGTVPKRNRDFWVAKFAANRKRDAEKIRALRRRGLRIALFWECEAYSPDVQQQLLKFFKSCHVDVR